MKLPFLRLLFIVVIASGTVACHKDHPPDSGGTTLDKTVTQYSGQPGVTATTQYQYDASNRLVLITSFSSQGNNVDSNKLVYDANGRLSQHIFSNSTIGPVERDSFWYDNNGRITRSRAIALAINLSVDDHTFAFDAQGRLVADSQRIRQFGPVFNYHKYTYDANDNVVRDDQFGQNGSAMEQESTAGISYDSHTNPLYKNSIAIYMATQNRDALSRNDPVNTNWQSSTGGMPSSTPVNCNYYRNGPLWHTTLVSTSPATGTVTTEYFYKAP